MMKVLVHLTALSSTTYIGLQQQELMGLLTYMPKLFVIYNWFYFQIYNELRATAFDQRKWYHTH